MLKDRKFWLASILGLVLVVASASASFAALSFGLKTTGTSTSGSVVYVSVANSTSAEQSGVVAVSALVGGKTVTAQVTVTVGPGQSTVVPVTFTAAPTRIISCGIIFDGGSPI